MKHIIPKTVLILLLSGLFVTDCTKKRTGTEPDPRQQKVAMDIYTARDDYSYPLSRADENDFEKEPMVLVFDGHGSDALFSEANKAVFNGMNSTVTLTVTDSPVTLMLITDMPGNLFSSGGTSLVFNPENLETVLQGKTITQVAEQGLLRTSNLGTGILSQLPFSGSSDRLPMSAVYKLAAVNSDNSIGSPDNRVVLTRAVAKVTVEVDPQMNPVFELISVAVVDAPASGSLLNLTGSPIDNTGNLVRYGDDGGGMAQAMQDIQGVFTTANDPIYLYESRADQGTMMIVKAIAEGNERYFPMPFYYRRYLPVLRNTHYTFRIIAAGNGYETLQQAIESDGNPDFRYLVTVSDNSSYDIVSNENIYIGTTASSIHTFVGETHKATISVFTDALQTNNNYTAIVPDPGLSVSHTALNLTSSAGSIGITHLEITIDEEFENGWIIMNIGTLMKEIEVTRYPQRVVDGIPFQLPHNDYVWGESKNTDWLSVSSDGITGWELLEKDAPGNMYIITNGKAPALQVGEVLAFRGPWGRTGIYVSRPR